MNQEIDLNAMMEMLDDCALIAEATEVALEDAVTFDADGALTLDGVSF